MTNADKDAMLTLSATICEKERELFETKKKLQDTKQKSDKIEIRTYVVVTNMKNQDSKPTYSNEKLREAEIQQRLSDNVEYQLTIVEADNLQSTIYEISIEIEYLKRNFRIEELFHGQVSK